MKGALFSKNVLLVAASLFFRKLLVLWKLAVPIFLLSSCISSSNPFTKQVLLAPYQIRVVQGNFVSRECIADNLRVGMKKREVLSLLGSPSLQDMFHSNRWDYIFYMRKGSDYVVKNQHLILYFSGEKLTRWSIAKELSSELEFIERIDINAYKMKKAN